MSDKEPTHSETALENTDNVMEEAVIIESDSEQEETPKKVKTGGLWIFSIFNFLLIIGICCAAVWTWYQWQQTQTNKTDNSAKIEAQIESMESSIAKMDSRLVSSGSVLADAKQEQNQQHEVLRSEIDELAQKVALASDENKALKSRIADLSGRRPADWLLAEADYLVRIAGRKLWLESDVSTAILMMQSADSRLEDIGDPSLFPVRTLIAEDIAALQKVNPVSTSSLALSLSGMISQVQDLPLNALKIPEIEENAAQNELSDSVSDWRTNISKTWNSLVDDFIQVETSDKPILPYLSTKQRWLITEQLKLALSQAKSAALAEQESLYLNSLQEAAFLLKEHFQLDDSAVMQFAEAIQELRSTSISKDYPSQLKSVNALKDLIEERMQNVFNNSAFKNNDSSNGDMNNKLGEGAL
ncbi:uroporphyrinogen-III C-methyltransferase [Glaciecola sp. MF2-115]|uniref:uroporphyrinogen-III C-methyltransferase n=1 Tax=Glaciecola sp. MF2-115 TaxID=3384827 RepID=UPI0039A06EAC